MIDHLRLFFYRHQIVLSLLYGCLLATFASTLYALARWLPQSMDKGLVIASRSMVHHGTFNEVDLAREDIQSGRLDDASKRLGRFLKQHTNIQPSQCYTRATSDACELLADVYIMRGKPGKAASVLQAMSKTTPMNYRLWYLQGRALKETGDLEEAADCLRKAYKLTLNHPEVTETYLSVLADLNKHDDILWVADQFERAFRNGAPKVEIIAGVSRDPLHRRIMDFAQIPIGHGTFLTRMVRCGLERGTRQRLILPRDMFDTWPVRGGDFVVNLCFKNVYDDLQVTGMRYRSKDEDEWIEQLLSEEQVAYLHQPKSGAEFYAEVRTGLVASSLREFELIYSCPEHVLSKDSEAIIAKARVNLRAKKEK